MRNQCSNDLFVKKEDVVRSSQVNKNLKDKGKQLQNLPTHYYKVMYYTKTAIVPNVPDYFPDFVIVGWSQAFTSFYAKLS